MRVSENDDEKGQEEILGETDSLSSSKRRSSGRTRSSVGGGTRSEATL